MDINPYLGNIGMAAFAFAPKGWALCNGQQLPIAQNQALFSILGTRYGGNGVTTFALPDLRGRTPMHVSGNHTLGEKAGNQGTGLTLNNIPSHFHGFTFQPPCNSGPGTTNVPTNNYPAATTTASYGTNADANLATPNNQTTVTTGIAGSSQPLPVMQPYLVINFCIALQGVFPSQD